MQVNGESHLAKIVKTSFHCFSILLFYIWCGETPHLLRISLTYFIPQRLPLDCQQILLPRMTGRLRVQQAYITFLNSWIKIGVKEIVASLQTYTLHHCLHRQLPIANNHDQSSDAGIVCVQLVPNLSRCYILKRSGWKVLKPPCREACASIRKRPTSHTPHNNSSAQSP